MQNSELYLLSSLLRWYQWLAVPAMVFSNLLEACLWLSMSSISRRLATDARLGLARPTFLRLPSMENLDLELYSLSNLLRWYRWLAVPAMVVSILLEACLWLSRSSIFGLALV